MMLVVVPAPVVHDLHGDAIALISVLIAAMIIGFVMEKWT